MSFESNFALWPILPFGADDGDENNGDQNNAGGENNANSGQQQQNSQNDGKQQHQTDDEDDDPYAGLSSKELKRLLAQSDKDKTTNANAAKTLQDKIDAENRKKNDDVTNLTQDLDKERGTNETLRAALAKQAILNGIVNDKRFEWKNIEIVAQQLDPSVVKVFDDGKVEGLAKELLRISKDDNLKFLLTKSEVQQQNNNQQQQKNNNGSTGFQPGQGGANGNGVGPNSKELAELMPALRSRL